MRRLLSLTWVAIVLLNGCANQRPASDVATPSETKQTVTPKIDACTLLSSSDVEEVLDEQVVNTEAAPTDDPDLARCIFDTNAFSGRITLEVTRHETEAGAQIASQLPGSEPAPDLADEAYLLTGEGEFDLKARKGLVVIRLILVSETSGPERIKALAAKALATLEARLTGSST